jgi:hypothetical protein
MREAGRRGVFHIPGYVSLLPGPSVPPGHPGEARPATTARFPLRPQVLIPCIIHLPGLGGCD